MLRLVCLLLSLRAPARGQGLLGRPDCPCVDPWRLPGGGPPEALTFVEEGTGRGCLRGEGGNCFPLDYGAKKCFAWDIGLAPRCANEQGRPLTNAPDFCKQPWCYVGSNCSTASHGTALFRGYALYYSYETCGAVDFFSAELLANTLKGKTLRAGVPGTSAPYVYNNGLERPTGWTADFANHVFETVGITVEIEAISEESAKEFPRSSYSACARDVALGSKDFCYGAFWETPERLIGTAFTPIYETATFVLAVPGRGSPALEHMIGKTFAPFSPGLWMVFFFLALVVGFTMWLFGEVGDVPLMSGVVLGLHRASLKLMGQFGGWDSLKSRSANVLLFGFTFMCMLGSATYTANLSSFLLMANLHHTSIQDLSDAIEQSVKICTLQAIVDSFSATYPGVSPLLVPFENWHPMADGFMAGQCGAMLLPPVTLEYMRAAAEPFSNHGREAFCNLKKVGDMLLPIPIAMPISRDLDNALSYVWAREKFQGEIAYFKNFYPSPSSDCPVVEGLRDEATPMHIADMSGGFLIIVLFFLASLAMHAEGSGRRPISATQDDKKRHQQRLPAAGDLEDPSSPSIWTIEASRSIDKDNE